jgi:hypothetical protein
LQLSTVDYGGCVILYRPPVDYGKAEIRCYDRGGRPPPSLGPTGKKKVCGYIRASFFGQRQPSKIG